MTEYRYDVERVVVRTTADGRERIISAGGPLVWPEPVHPGMTVIYEDREYEVERVSEEPLRGVTLARRE